MMKNIKRFEIDVESAFGDDNFNEYPLNIEDLENTYADAMDDNAVVEITIYGDGDATAKFTLNLKNIEALFDVLGHIRDKVLEQKPETEDKSEKEKE